MKPLFIPLKTEFYEAFERGEKLSELRLYGPRWNERTCPVGRAVVLSKGYGKAHRLNSVVDRFLKRDARTFGSTYQASIMKLYGSLDLPIAEIRLIIEPTLPRRGNRNLPDIYDFVKPGTPLTPSQVEDQRAWIRYDEEANKGPGNA